MEAPKGGGPKISRFFFPPPATIFFLLSLSWGPFVEFWWCLKRRGPEMCTFGVLGLSCEAPAAPKPQGLHTIKTRAQTCTFQGPGLQTTHHQNATKRPQERERRMKIVAGGGKKRAKFWAVRRRVVRRRVVRRRVVRRRVVRRRVVRRRVVQRKGPSEMGCRVRGFGFSSGFCGRKQKQEKNKMKREMSKNKKKVKKSKKTKQKKRKKERMKKQSKHHLFDFGKLISTSANFDFGQFRFRPAGRSRIVRSRASSTRTPLMPCRTPHLLELDGPQNSTPLHTRSFASCFVVSTIVPKSMGIETSVTPTGPT